jgi:hypothetical protein
LGETTARLAEGKFDGEHVELKVGFDEVMLIHIIGFVCLI